MRTVKNVLSFAAFAVIVVVTVCYIASFRVHAAASEDRINLSMDVPDTKGLAAGSRVLLRGWRWERSPRSTHRSAPRPFAFTSKGVTVYPSTPKCGWTTCRR